MNSKAFLDSSRFKNSLSPKKKKKVHTFRCEHTGRYAYKGEKSRVPNQVFPYF